MAKVFTPGGVIEAGISNTKIRAEQIKTEDSMNSLAGDLFVLRSQIASIIGTGDHKEDIDSYDVQLAELNPHLSGSFSGTVLKVKQQLKVIGTSQFDSALNVDAQATFDSVNVTDLTSGRIVVAGAAGELEGFEGLTFSGGELTAASATVTDLTPARVVYAGTAGALVDSANMTFDGTDLTVASAKVTDLTDGRVVYAGVAGALVDSSEMTFGAGGLTLAKDLAARSGSFSGDVTIAGDLLVQGNTVTVDVGTLLIEDKSVVIAKAATGSSLDGAGIFLGSESGESISWNHADTKWVASDKFAAETLQATDLSSNIVWADGSGNLVEITDQQLADAIEGRLVAGTGVSISETGAAITVAIGQPVAIADSVTFAAVTGSNLTAARLMASNDDQGMVSVANLADWVAGTVNQVTVANDGDGSITLGLPQNIHSAASPQFAKVFIDGAGASDAFIDTDGADMLVLGYRDAAGTGAVSLPVAQAGNYTLSGFTATSIVGALNELKSAASASSKKAVYTVAGSAVASGTDIKASLSSDFLAELTGQNSLVFVNGMLMLAGGADYTLAAGALSFTFDLQIGDVVIVQKA